MLRHAQEQIDHRRQIQVRDRERVAEQVGTIREVRIQHLERAFEALLRPGDHLRVLLLIRGEEHLHDDLHLQRLDLTDPPHAPLVRARPILRRVRVQPVAIALRQIQIDRHRLEKHEVPIDQRRHPPVRIHRQVLRRLRLRPEMRRHMLVLDSDLLHRPDGAKGTRSGETIEPTIGHEEPSKRECVRNANAAAQSAPQDATPRGEAPSATRLAG